VAEFLKEMGRPPPNWSYRVGRNQRAVTRALLAYGRDCRAMPAGFIAPCLPTPARQPPRGPEWLIEIKHDGFRVIARKDGKRVRLYSRPGNDLTTDFRSFSRRSRGCGPGRTQEGH
jgi:ATP-dependent DNA ligase